MCAELGGAATRLLSGRELSRMHSKDDGASGN